MSVFGLNDEYVLLCCIGYCDWISPRYHNCVKECMYVSMHVNKPRFPDEMLLYESSQGQDCVRSLKKY